jgi:hypothetical protein
MPEIVVANDDCSIREAEHCYKCKDRICSKVPIIVHILSSGDKRKVQNLVDVFSKYELVVSNYI